MTGLLFAWRRYKPGQKSWKSGLKERLVPASSLLAPEPASEDPRLVKLRAQVAALKTDPMHMKPFKESAGRVYCAGERAGSSRRVRQGI